MAELNLDKLGISGSIKNIDVNSVKNIVKKIRKINNAIANISDEADQEESELKQLKLEIQKKCSALLARQKEIKQNKKNRNNNRMLFLGERRAYFNELKELGLSFKEGDVNEIPNNSSKRTELIPSEG